MKRSDTLTSTAPSSIDEGDDSPVHIRHKTREVIGDYYIGKLLGTGTFGIVRFGKHIPSGKKVAIKVVNKVRAAKHQATELITREIKILQ